MSFLSFSLAALYLFRILHRYAADAANEATTPNTPTPPCDADELAEWSTDEMHPLSDLENLPFAGLLVKILSLFSRSGH